MLWTVLYYILFGFALAVLCIILVGTPSLIIARYYFARIKKRNKISPNVAFFHPYCNSGGGGERVLWCAISALLEKYPSIKIVVYTGDVDASPEDIIKRADERFNIKLLNSIEFIYLHKRAIVEAENYPYFTILGQSLGSVLLGIEALKSFVPDVYIETTGYSFTLPLFSLLGKCKVASYVHYPTITSDMIKQVATRRVSPSVRGKIAKKNRQSIAISRTKTLAKLIYYKLFSILYQQAGRFSDVIMVNSSWTEEHINALWGQPLKTYRVYPPCDTSDFQKISRDIEYTDKIKIISVGQFRPEKDHPLQLNSMYYLRQLINEDLFEKMELVLIGSTRNEEDETLVKDMKDLCRHLSLENNVTFRINASYADLKKELEHGLIGIHTMWNEHFGIGIVECMAAGLIMITHKSGGPMMDIIEETSSSRNGFLATSEKEYAESIAVILSLPKHHRNIIRDAARSSVNRFSTQEFKSNFLRATELLFNLKKDNNNKLKG